MSNKHIVSKLNQCIQDNFQFKYPWHMAQPDSCTNVMLTKIADVVTVFKRAFELISLNVSIFLQSLETEVIFDVFDLFHHVTNLLALFSEDILNDLLLMGIE